MRCFIKRREESHLILERALKKTLSLWTGKPFVT